MTPALAARVAQIEAEREHAAAVAEFRAQMGGTFEQARVNVEDIAREGFPSRGPA